MPVQDHMRPQDIEAFKAAAKYFDAWILVRRTNPKSKDYIGIAGYVPKRMDCKAKTADLDVNVPGFGRKLTAGLVVDPTVPGFERAFNSPQKLGSARYEWEKFKPFVYFPDPAKPVTYFPNGKLYSVQMDPNHKHYGCVTFSSASLVSAAQYIHGDYDLYAVISRKDPANNVRVLEERLGQPHARGKEFFDVQHFINGKIGVPMILHGEQEKMLDHSDETVDVFWPTGEVTEAVGKTGLRALYESMFRGRQTFAAGAPTKPAGGQWQKR